MSDMFDPRPPRIAERLLMKIVGGRDAEVIAGDLREAYSDRGGGRLWYCSQVASCLLVRLSPHRRLVPDLRYDLHYALRILRRNPGYAVAAMICLALGIGVNTTIFSWLDEMYLRRLPVPDPTHVVSVDRAGGPPCSWREYRDFNQSLSSFSGIAALIPKGTYMDIDRVNDQIHAEVVSANYFHVLGINPKLGRPFLPSDDTPASDRVVVMSDRVWSRRFQRDPQAIGKLIRIEDRWYRIVGVAPPDFRGASAPLAVDAWVPLATYPHYQPQLAADASAAGPGVFLIGRLAASQTIAQASAELDVVDARMRQAAPKNPRLSIRMSVRSIAGYSWAEARRGLLPVATLLAAVAGIVLLIACINVANLLLSRAAVRQREMSVRLALGAGRGRLIRQAITEGLVLAIGGAGLGITLGFWTNQLIGAMLPSSNPELAIHTLYLDVNGRVMAFTAAISILCALLFSISPALENVRADLTPTMKGQSGPGAGARQSRQRDLYVIAQVALSLVLLIAAGLLVRALQQAKSTDPGFATDNRFYIRLFTPEGDFTPPAATSLYQRLLDEARSLPGVRDATLSFAVFGFMDGDCASITQAESPRKLSLNVVESNYFNFVRVPLLRGRTFSSADRPESPRVIIVNETMARRWWPGEDPIGKTAWLGCDGSKPRVPAEVIGVARDSKYGSLDEQPRPFYFVYWRQVWWNGFFALMLHTAGDPHELAQPLLTLARTGGPNLRIYEMRSLNDLVALSLWQVRWQAGLLAAFSLLAIVLATVGLYGVVAYMVAQRTREIGIRMALGAQSIDVKWIVLGRGLRLTTIGILLGLVLSAAATQLLRRFLFGVSPLDPAPFTAAALAWILISMLASYLPARRATRVDPVVALRYE